MQVAVLGAGYAGVTLARRLETRLPPDVDLTVVNETPTHLVRHEVHRVIRRPEIEDTITVPLSEVIGDAELVEDRVTGIDASAGIATLESGRRLDYDYGAVCLGSETAYYDLPGVEEHSLPLKTTAQARAIREAVVPVCENGGTVVIGGAGLSGIQVAGEITALAGELRSSTVPDSPDPDTPEDRSDPGVRTSEGTTVVLLEQFETVAPNFPDPFRNAVRTELEKRGVDVRTGTAVQRATANAVVTDQEELSYDAFIWTGGITGQAATDGTRPTVQSDLRLSESTFVVGDAGKILDADGEPVPASASAAIREARTAATNICRLAEAHRNDQAFEPRLERYRFDVPGWIVSIGDGAVAQVGPTVLTGAPARAAKAAVGAGYLSSVRALRQAVDLAEAELR